MGGALSQGEDEDEEAALNEGVPLESSEDSDGELSAGEDGEAELPDSSDDDDTDAVYTTVGRAPPHPPAGFRYVDQCPALDSDETQIALVGKQILHAFDQEGLMGWFIGRISARGVSARDLARTPTANFVVSYDKKTTGERLLHGRVASSLVADKYGPTEWWILLEPNA